MKKVLFVLMLISLNAVAQKTFDFTVVSADEQKDTIHIETMVKNLALQWKDGHVDLYPYPNGVYAVGNADIICFDDYTIARYLIVYYTSDKRDKVDYALLQYNNGSGIEFNALKGGTHGKR